MEKLFWIKQELIALHTIQCLQTFWGVKTFLKYVLTNKYFVISTANGWGWDRLIFCHEQVMNSHDQWPVMNKLNNYMILIQVSVGSDTIVLTGLVKSKKQAGAELCQAQLS